MILSPRFQVCLVALAALALSACQEPQPGGTPSVGKLFDRVVIVVLENAGFGDAEKDPYLKSLEPRGALLSNFHGVTHPSYPNYLAMVAGRLFATLMDKQIDIDQKSVADLLEAKGLTWKNYAEDYPGNCDLDSTAGNYARKHVPFLSFTSIQSDPARCARVVPGSQFQTDWAAKALPTYSFYSPNLVNDGHNSSVAVASQWLKGFLEPLLADKERMKGTLVVVTFDEDDNYVSENQIYTVLLGPVVKTGAVDATSYSHYSLLKTVEQNFGLGTLGGEDVETNDIGNVWTAK